MFGDGWRRDQGFRSREEVQAVLWERQVTDSREGEKRSDLV